MGGKTYVFIDASNLFYGGKKSLGWTVDYEKLFIYLQQKYQAEKIYYFGGVETFNYQHDYLGCESVDLKGLKIELYSKMSYAADILVSVPANNLAAKEKLKENITNYISECQAQHKDVQQTAMACSKRFNCEFDAQKIKSFEELRSAYQKTKFYLKLQNFGYLLVVKPVKFYPQQDGTVTRKANCDVDLTFYLMKEKDNYKRAVVLAGDGDYLPVLKYLKDLEYEVIILARSHNTAQEIKKFAGSNFRDFIMLKKDLEQIEESQSIKRSGHTKYPLQV
ncbi:MAG: NYN domain-containing protein [Patescibacteria group bacterium]|jgi:uncharacterized LabA/DUF88 family protein